MSGLRSMGTGKQEETVWDIIASDDSDGSGEGGLKPLSAIMAEAKDKIEKKTTRRKSNGSPKTAKTTAKGILSNSSKVTKTQAQKTTKAKTSTPARKPKKTVSPQSTSRYFENAPKTKATGTNKAKKTQPAPKTPQPAHEYVELSDDETPVRAAPRRRDAWTPVRNTVMVNDISNANSGTCTPSRAASDCSLSSAEKRKANDFGELLDTFRNSSEEVGPRVQPAKGPENVKPKRIKLGTVTVAPKEKPAPKPKAPPKPRAPRKPKATPKKALTITELAQQSHARNMEGKVLSEEDIVKDLGPSMVLKPEEAKVTVKEQAWMFGTSSQLLNGSQEQTMETALEETTDGENIVNQESLSELPKIDFDLSRRSIWDIGASQLEATPDCSDHYIFEDVIEDEQVPETSKTAEEPVVIPSSPAQMARESSWSGTSVSSQEKVPDSPIMETYETADEVSMAGLRLNDDNVPVLEPPSPGIAEPIERPASSTIEIGSFDIHDLTTSPVTAPTTTDLTQAAPSPPKQSPRKHISLFTISDDEEMPPSYQPRRPSTPLRSPLPHSREAQSKSHSTLTSLQTFNMCDDNMIPLPSQSSFFTTTINTISKCTLTIGKGKNLFHVTDSEDDDILDVSSKIGVSRQSIGLTSKAMLLSPSSPGLSCLARPFSTSSVVEAKRKTMTTKTSKTSTLLEKDVGMDQNTASRKTMKARAKNSEKDESEVEDTIVVAKPKRGRPPKAAIVKASATAQGLSGSDIEENSAVVKPKRGRPPKTTTATTVATIDRASAQSPNEFEVEDTAAVVKPKRGRPTKAAAAATALEASVRPTPSLFGPSESDSEIPLVVRAKRERPAKTTASKSTAIDGQSDPETEAVPAPKLKRGRPPKTAGTAADEPKALVRNSTPKAKASEPAQASQFAHLTTAEMIKRVDSYGMKAPKSRKALFSILESVAASIAEREAQATGNTRRRQMSPVKPLSPVKAPASPLRRRSRSRSPLATAALTASAAASGISVEFMGHSPKELQAVISQVIRESEYWERILCYEPVVLQELVEYVNGEEGKKITHVTMPEEAVRQWADACGVCFKQAEGMGWNKGRTKSSQR